jgi:hypothetical protein
MNFERLKPTAIEPARILGRWESHTDRSRWALPSCPRVRAKVKRLRDLKNDFPGAANNRRKYSSAMFGWAIETTLR